MMQTNIFKVVGARGLAGWGVVRVRRVRPGRAGFGWGGGQQGPGGGWQGDGGGWLPGPVGGV